jgi:acetyl/propionyl-CoA carboxylase alpha subunit
MKASRKITRVLIANRGEIARRVIRTCSKMGIETVAVFSSVDAHAPHVKEATKAECIGEPTAYLNISTILDAAKRSGADAIHPGYGFLSENAEFAAAVDKAGITFIGPSSEAIRKLGSKTAAKELAKKANVPMSPTLLLSSKDTKANVAEIIAFGKKVGFPLILKAAAGGGGRGMRFITSETGLEDELQSARRESEKAFGSDEVFAEKCITPARHVEIQVAVDSKGVAMALGSRDCSLQRSNQKIIEEAPAQNLAQGVEVEMFKAACALAKASGYTNLGTVEFLYGPDGSFYFLEVNTRLQVEHPVTEAVTGLDLVEVQIRIARGETLESCGVSKSPTPKGHALEARWCAEEFTTTFVTSTGIVLEVSVPPVTRNGESIRFDSGIEPCSEVTHHYDSLIGKVIVHSSDRKSAIAALDEALAHSRISGVKTNRSLLLHLLRTPEFKSLTHTVQGTASLLPTKEQSAELTLKGHTVAAAIRCATPLSRWVKNAPWLSERIFDTALAYSWTTTSGDSSISSSTRRVDAGFVVQPQAAGEKAVTVSTVGEVDQTGNRAIALVTRDGGPVFEVTTLKDGANLWVHLPEGTVVLHEEVHGGRKKDSQLEGSGNVVRSSIPGRVAAVSVAEGQTVQQGDTLLILDSMKMEHPIRAPIAGVVKSLPSKVDAIVQSGSVLAVLEG